MKKRSEASAEMNAKTAELARLLTASAPKDEPPSRDAVDRAYGNRQNVAYEISVDARRVDAPDPKPEAIDLHVAVRNPGSPTVSPDYARIVERIYAVDVWRDYELLERDLEVGDGRGDFATVAKHVDAVETKARRAHALYLSAKLELLRFQQECERVQAGMRTKALDSIEDEKAAGERKKQITDGDVRSRMFEMFPDEFGHEERKLAELKGAVDHLERLAELWKTRTHTAGILLTTLRR